MTWQRGGRHFRHWGLKVDVLSQLGTVGFQGPLALQGHGSCGHSREQLLGLWPQWDLLWERTRSQPCSPDGTVSAEFVSLVS